MEVDTSLKSILKTPKTVNKNRHRKVSFSNTAKLFFSDKNVEGTSGKFQLKYVEVSIVDNSMTVSSNTLIFDDCKAEDFLVHKVIYNSDVVSEDDTENNTIINSIEQNNDLDSEVHYVEIELNDKTRNSVEIKDSDEDHEHILTDSKISVVNDSSNLEEQKEDSEHDFVVHKVDFKDDRYDYVIHKVPHNENQESELQYCLFKDELNSTSITDIAQNNSQVSFTDSFDVDFETKPISKLSIENIQEHDKIIAYNDQNSLNSSSVVEAMSNVLMLEKLIDFGELEREVLQATVPTQKLPVDIVLSPPLQELSLDKIVQAHTDNILCELDISPLNSVQETDSDSDISSEDTMIMMTSEECQKNEKHIQESLLQYQSIKERKESNVNEKSATTTDDVKDYLEIEEKVFGNDLWSRYCAHQAQVLENQICDQVVEQPSNLNQKVEIELVENHQKPTIPMKELSANDGYCDFSSGSTIKTSANWDKTLLTIEIPKDVREWKIMPISKYDSCYSSENKTDPNSCLNEIQSSSNSSHLPQASKSDELEHFVNESTERVERIRKRYYSNNKTQVKFERVEESSIRGIKPRFGSTAEILQLMQKQNTSLLHYGSTRNHISWPFSDSNEYRAVNHNRGHSSSEHLHNNQMHAGIYSSLHSDICDHFPFESVKRGVPEGASPPRSLEEEHFREESNNQNQDSMVYYSMKV